MPRVCVYGHEVSGSNLYTAPGGKEICKTCQWARNRVYQDKIKAANALKPKLPYRTTVYDLMIRLRVDENGCLIWPGKKQRDGYGIARVNGKDVRAHRAVYEHYKGPVPDGLVLDHVKERCKSRACCNVEHLEPCTITENILRAHPDIYGRAGRNKTHCPYGHPLSGENVRFDNRGFRSCGTCRNEKKRQKRDAERVTPYKARPRRAEP